MNALAKPFFIDHGPDNYIYCLRFADHHQHSHYANFNSTATLDNGITFSNGTILTYMSNKAYFITINSQTANFSGGSSPAMPASVIGYKLHTNPTYVALTSTATNLVGALGSESVAEPAPGYRLSC